MAAYLIFTVDRGHVVPGARVEKFVLRGAGVEVPALLLGEEGRGRKLFPVPVVGAAPGDTILAAEVGQTRTGRPKLLARPEATTDEAALDPYLEPFPHPLPHYWGKVWPPEVKGAWGTWRRAGVFSCSRKF
ncbi:hypothetical protein Theos_2263 (plasmid) [Thermus oshimai JL-2]|uniref:Uncharacterized protein n=1 Tax=Thermus oshimai JL-2 TaxID=751945 RepID=K7QYW6_THEOS|nr:hypothetical protein [Thermus oshimai]AFV77253.1 hypothetical protein Theos_2263 [Thermus oshimai JL-2]